MTREQLLAYIAQHPEQRQSLLSPTTLVRRQGEHLTAIPYAQAYSDELARVAKLLLQAADFTSHDRFRAFLSSRAAELPTDSLRHSEALWVQTAGSPIDIAIGPYEVYDDALLGIKASYEAIVMVLHPMTARLRQFEALASQLEQRLHGAAAPPESRRRVAIGVYDVVYAAGMANRGSKMIAATLPNDEHVRKEFGSRLLLFRNIISAKFEPILKPLARGVLREDQLYLVQEDAFLYHTLLHEMAHALSAGFVRRGNQASDETIHQALKERYSTIEECRADLVGMVFLDFLAGLGLLPADISVAAAATFVVNKVRTVRFGAGEDHSRGSAIILSRLLRKGAIQADTDYRFRVDTRRAQPVIGEFAEEVQRICVNGDYDAAGRLIQSSASVPVELERLLPGLANVPTDVEFVFDRSGGLF